MASILGLIKWMVVQGLGLSDLAVGDGSVVAVDPEDVPLFEVKESDDGVANEYLGELGDAAPQLSQLVMVSDLFVPAEEPVLGDVELELSYTEELDTVLIDERQGLLG